MRLKFWKKDLQSPEVPDMVISTTTADNEISQTTEEVKEEMYSVDSMFDDPLSFDDDDEFDSFYEEDYDGPPYNSLTISVRNIADGASNLAELADMLRIMADYADSLNEDGYILYENIRDGSGFAYLPEGE
jgi:hypothetical protein